MAMLLLIGIKNYGNVVVVKGYYNIWQCCCYMLFTNMTMLLLKGIKNMAMLLLKGIKNMTMLL